MRFSEFQISDFKLQSPQNFQGLEVRGWLTSKPWKFLCTHFAVVSRDGFVGQLELFCGAIGQRCIAFNYYVFAEEDVAFHG